MGNEFTAKTQSAQRPWWSGGMMYQFEHDYRFDSSKLEQALNLTATDYRTGIAITLQG